MKNWLTSGLATTALLGFAFTASAQVPTTIQYQGKLMTTADEMAFEGTGDMEVKFGTEDASTVTYEETIEDVAIANGLFSVTIGESNAIPVEAFTTPSLFLHLTFTPDGGAAEVFAPVPLTSMPYAHVAATAVTAQNIAVDGNLGQLIDNLDQFLKNSAPTPRFSTTESYGILRNDPIEINFNQVASNVDTAVLVGVEGGIAELDYEIDDDSLDSERTLEFKGLVAGDYVITVRLSNAAGTTDVTINIQVVNATSFSISTNNRPLDLTGSRALDAGESFTLSYTPSTNLPNVKYRFVSDFTDFTTLAVLDDEPVTGFIDAPSFTVDSAGSENDATYVLEVYIAPDLLGTDTPSYTFGDRNTTFNPVDVDVKEDISFPAGIDVTGETTSGLSEDAYAGDNITLIATATPIVSPYSGGDISYTLQRRISTRPLLYETLEENSFGAFSLGRVINRSFAQGGNEGQYRVIAKNDSFIVERTLDFSVQSHIVFDVVPDSINPITVDASLNQQLSVVTRLVNPSGLAAPEVRWQKRGINENSNSDFDDIGQTTGDVVFIPAGQGDTGGYRLVATTPYDSLATNASSAASDFALVVEDDINVVSSGMGATTNFVSGGPVTLTFDTIIRDSTNTDTVTAGRVNYRLSRPDTDPQDNIDDAISFNIGSPAREVTVKWFLQNGAFGAGPGNAADTPLTTGSLDNRVTVTQRLVLPNNNGSINDLVDASTTTPGANGNGYVRNRSTLSIILTQPSLDGRTIYALVSTTDSSGKVLTSPVRFTGGNRTSTTLNLTRPPL